MTPEIHDGQWRLMRHDPLTGETLWHMVGEAGEDLFRLDQPMDLTVEANARERNDTAGQRFGEWRRVASMPVSHLFHSGLQEALNQGDKAWLSRFLNDGDNRAFRTFEGKV